MSEYRHIANLRGEDGRDGDNIPGATFINPIVIYQDTDLSSLGRGVYRLAAGSIAVELGLPQNMLGTLEIFSGSSARDVMRFTSLVTDNTPLMVFMQTADSDATWTGDWTQTYPQPGVIDTFITDPNAYIEDGQTAAIINERHSALDLGTAESRDLFSLHAEENPDAWATFMPANSFEHGGQMSFARNEQAAALWETHGEFSDGEVLIRACLSSFRNTQAACAVIRGSSWEDFGYMAGVYEFSGETYLRLAKSESGGATLMGTHQVDVVEDQVFMIRLRAEGDQIQAKLWIDGELEPVGWGIDHIDGTHQSGKAGLGTLGGGNVSRFNYISVNSDGGTA